MTTTHDARQRALLAARRGWGQEWSPAVATRAPGRLELLGNHIDYNGGPVLAAAIDRDTICLACPFDGPGIEVLLSDVSDLLESLDPGLLKEWRNSYPNPRPMDYVRGVIASAHARGVNVRNSIQLSVAGDVPIGLGLSSSASLCVALTLLLHIPTARGRDLVLRAQEAEHRAGTPCGTMDQAASVGGKVILYDGSNATWEKVNPDLGSFVFAVADSGVSRALASSSYPLRVEESRDALNRVNVLLGSDFGALADLDQTELTAVESATKEAFPGTLKRRVRHVVTETNRVREGLDAMERGDWRRFGALMSDSGRSSAEDYEISHPLVEELVAIARDVPGVAGARMMGGGEGGTALILLENDAVPGLVAELDQHFYRTHPVSSSPPVNVFRFADGAG
jgi:galactokinase